MAREITEEQVALLEEHHGKGMVVVLSVGDTDFAFRRLSELDVDIVLLAMENGQYGCHEQAALRCLLSVDAPAENKADLASTGDKRASVAAALVAERQLLSSFWAQAQAVRDIVGMTLAKECGWQWAVASEPLGGDRYKLICRRTKEDGQTLAYDLSDTDAVPAESVEVPVELMARTFTPIEYGEWRRRMVVSEKSTADRYAYKLLVQGEGRDEVARRYPYLAMEVGKVLSGLGAESKAVSVKKFGAPGSQAPRRNSTKPPEPTSP